MADFRSEHGARAPSRLRKTTVVQLKRDVNITTSMLMISPDKARYKCFSFRVKDATSGRRLRALGVAVNTVWNYCNEISARSAERGQKWIDKKTLRKLTKGASRELALPSQVIQEIIDEFIVKRREAGRQKLRWRKSRGVRRSLGWVPFTNQDVEIVGTGVAMLRGQKFRFWQHRGIDGRIKSGNFSEDARGRWYINLVVEVPKPEPIEREAIVGIDIGFKTAAQAAIITEAGVKPWALKQSRFYRDVEPWLAEAQRRGRKRQVKTLHAKIANRRKDALHKFSRAVANAGSAVFVGNISSTWQIASGKGKATLDVSWSMLRNLVRYKCDHAGVAFAEVNEAFTTQDCSVCHARSGPKGAEGLEVRQWVCIECGAVHDRDLNGAVNIARVGCDALGLKWPGSLSSSARRPG